MGMKRKILVVDDEPLILKTIERALIKVGYDVQCTQDMDSFMLILGEMSRPPDLMILDMNLGKINTEHMIEQVRELAPDSRILFISGSFPEIFEDRDFLEKPFRIDELRLKIKEMLGEP